MTKRRATARPTRTAEHKQLQMLKDATAEAAQLRVAQEELDEGNSFVFVCIEALRAEGGVDATRDILRVPGHAYETLVLDAHQSVRGALKALGQDGGE